MIRLIILIFSSFISVSCVTPVYDGKDIIVDSEGNKVCGLHGTKVDKNKGYFYSSGLISPTIIDGRAERRFPNTTHVGFSPYYEDKSSFQYTRPGIIHTCKDCEDGRDNYRAKFSNLPHWYTRLILNHTR
jgi:hypothetical protein